MQQLCNEERVGGHGIQNGEYQSLQALTEVRSPTHERIPESVKMLEGLDLPLT